MTPPRVAARGMAVSGRFRGASGTPPPTVCPGMGGDGRPPLIRPCGATFPQGGRQGLLLAAAGGRGGVGAPRPTDGDMETLWGLREQSFPGRRAVGAGHARPEGLRRQASTVRSVGRGLDPSAGGYRGMGVGGRFRGASGTPPPTVCPGNGRQREAAAGWGTPPYGWGYGNAVGFTRAPVPGPPRGRGRACPARGVAWAAVNGSVRREGS